MGRGSIWPFKRSGRLKIPKLSRHFNRFIHSCSSNSKALTASAANSPHPQAQPQNTIFIHKQNIASMDDLRLFENNTFDVNAYIRSQCQPMSEQEVMQLRSRLLDLRNAALEEMRHNIITMNAVLVRAPEEMSGLRRDLNSVRNIVSSNADIIRGLAERTRMDVSSASTSSDNGESASADLDECLSELRDVVDVQLAERRVYEALDWLNMAENLDAENCLSELRGRIAEQLAEAASQPSASREELRRAVAELDRLGDGNRAHSLLLGAHYRRLQYKLDLSGISAISPNSFSRHFFSAILHARMDSVAIFGEGSIHGSKLVDWACKVIEEFVILLGKQCLISAVKSSSTVLSHGGIGFAARCVQISLEYCSCLESAHGLALDRVLLERFIPIFEQKMEEYLRLMEERIASVAAADNWAPKSTGPGLETHDECLKSRLRISSSAQEFFIIVQCFVEDVEPLHYSMQLEGTVLDGIAQLFNSYVGLLRKALPGNSFFDDDDGCLKVQHKANTVVLAKSEGQQIVLLGNAFALANVLLPLASSKLRHQNDDQSQWRRGLQQAVNQLCDDFCRQHVLHLIFTEDGNRKCTVDDYLDLDGNNVDHSWCENAMRSPIFQEFLIKAEWLAEVAAEFLAVPQGVVAKLMMRLTETFLLWVYIDLTTFWDDIEDGSREPLSFQGLQQFVLNMQRVVQFASQRCCPSRHAMEVAKDAISKAYKNASIPAATNFNSGLPREEWFIPAAQKSLLKLFGESSSGPIDESEPVIAALFKSSSQYQRSS